MAKDNKLAQYAIWGVGGYVFYNLGKSGFFGVTIQDMLILLAAGFGGKTDGTGGKTDGTGGKTDPGKTTGDAELDAIIARNPNFMAQMAEWQAARTARGELPDDWSAFRQHLMAIGAPNPGGLPPSSLRSKWYVG